MICVGWLIIEGYKRHGRGSWQAKISVVRRNKPNTKRNEVAIRLEIELPDTLFERPQLEAQIKVPDSELGKPVVTSEVQDNLAEVLSKQMGMEVRVSYPGADEEESE